MSAARWPAAALLAMLAAAADAQERKVQITPYVWGVGIGGSLTPLRGGPTLDFDEGLSDVLADLDSAFFLSGYARFDRIVVLGDISASRSSRDARVPVLGLPVKGRVEQRSITLAAGYRVLQQPALSIDVLGGLRHWRFEAGARTPLPGLAGDIDLAFTDPILGARTNIRLADRWSLIAHADLGGFGAGSDVTAQAVATVNWQASDALFLSLGYRHLYLDYDDDGRAFDVHFSGPLAGVTLQF